MSRFEWLRAASCFFAANREPEMHTTTKPIAEENSMTDLEHHKQMVIAFYVSAFTDHAPAVLSRRVLPVLRASARSSN